jgi:hypothetical protein
MPNEVQTFYEDLEQGHDSEWTFFVDYDVVRVILFDWVVLHWIYVTFVRSELELRFEIKKGVRETDMAYPVDNLALELLSLLALMVQTPPLPFQKGTRETDMERIQPPALLFQLL